MHYFLAEDLALLEQKVQETAEKLKDVGNELRLATTQSSETWHDNFGFENAQQQARLLGQRLDDLEKIRRNAFVIEMPDQNKAVAIGHTVTVKEATSGETKMYRIGSHIAFTQNTISYASPIGSFLLGKKIGQRAKGIIGTKERVFEIIEIA